MTIRPNFQNAKKQYNNNNRDVILERKKQYFAKNIDTIKEKQKIKMTCKCDCVVNRQHIMRHKRSKKHLELLKQSQ